jgi:signal transduction histidine kinase
MEELKPVDVVPQDITRVFLNLFGNAFYAIRKRQRDDGGDAYRPTLKVSTRDVGETVEIRIRDNGNGIPESVRAKMFEPFFTTKPAGAGTGLGLSMTFDIIVQSHKGAIDVETAPGEFAEFISTLPRKVS